MEIINNESCGLVLRTDTLDMDLIRLLETQYIVIVEKKSNLIQITLESK